MRVIAAVLLAWLFAFPAGATDGIEAAPPIAGARRVCKDIRGVEVLTYRVVNLGDVGFARFVNRIPVIMIDPHILATLPPKLQLFFYLHECAHHALGHWFVRPPTAEADADCWAVKRGRDDGDISRQDVEQFEPWIARSNGTASGHLAGPERERHLLRCFDEH